MTPDSPVNDEADMLALQRGEELALNRLMAHWQTPLRSFLYRRTQNEADALDADAPVGGLVTYQLVLDLVRVSLPRTDGATLVQFKLSDGSYIILGTSWWLTPHGHKIFGTGIQPDESVPMAAGTLPADPTAFTTMTVAQLNSSGDAELLAAVKDLNK